MSNETPLIRLDRVGRVFDDGAVVALNEVSVDIAAGERVAVLGKSGSGKSTLIHIMGGCDHPSTGAVLWHGEAVRSRSRWQALRATDIGIVFQEFHLIPALTAIENVELALMGAGLGASKRIRRAQELLERVGLQARLNHLPKKMSGGERQRVAIARAIANRPCVVLADEPTGNLDSANAAAVSDLLFELSRTEGTTLVLATHDAALADKCARRITIRDGRVVEDQHARERQADGADEWGRG